MIAGSTEVSPKSFETAIVVDLAEFCREEPLPFCNRLDAIFVLGVRERQFVVDINPRGSEFQNVSILFDGPARVGLIQIVIAETQIPVNGRRTMFQLRRQGILGRTLLCVAQILAIARPIVEPNVACKLIFATTFLPEAFSNRFVAERIHESRADRRFILRKVQPDKRRVRFGPNRWTSAAPYSNRGMGQVRGSIRQNIFRSRLPPRSPLRGDLDKLLRIFLQ